jgi:hypothetical protein
VRRAVLFTDRHEPVPAEWMPRRALFAAPSAGAAPNVRPVALREWRLLFNGRDLSGWVVEDRPELWTVEDGAIVCQGRGGGMLRSQEQFGDFALALEYNVNPRVNSGVFVRWSDIRDPVNTGIEVQVLDSAHSRNPNKHDSGALYDLVAPSVNTAKPAGQWNRMVIACQGPIISVRLNGPRVAEMDVSRYTRPGKNPDGTGNKFRYAMGALPRRGYIGLQNHGGRVLYRNLRVLVLEDAGGGNSGAGRRV